MAEFVTDRTQYNVELLNRLRKKTWSSMTTSEQNQWYGEAAKGAYNYSDLNRVEGAVKEIASKQGLSLTTKTNWHLWSIPTQSDMERYLSNVVAVVEQCGKKNDISKFPKLPTTMNGLTYQTANNIEECLYRVYSIEFEGYDPASEAVLGKIVLGKSTL